MNKIGKKLKKSLGDSHGSILFMSTSPVAFMKKVLWITLFDNASQPDRFLPVHTKIGFLAFNGL